MASIPNGITASFSNVRANDNTATFVMSAGMVVITFNPRDVDRPGVLTLYDSGNNALLTMTQGGSYPWQVPSPSASYYFSSTAHIGTVAMTLPNDLRG